MADEGNSIPQMARQSLRGLYVNVWRYDFYRKRSLIIQLGYFMVIFTFFDGPYRNRTYDLRIMNVRYGSEADDAINALNESSFKGRNIKVNQAKPRGDRPQRRSRY